jgi:hypothetical protein
MADHHSPAYQELYEFLVACFVHADDTMSGKVGGHIMYSDNKQMK